VGAGVRIDEVDAVVDSAMPVNPRAKIVVRTPAITDDCSAGLDPVTYDGNQCIGSVRQGTRNVLPDSRSIPPNAH
jgi:hypothetical protein